MSTSSAGSQNSEVPLMMEGMRVIEVANVLAGPSVGQFLAELGAEVIKVESPVTNGDVTRTWRLGSEPLEEDVTAYFSTCNLGKKSMVVDLSKEDGRQILRDLAQNADCFLASFKPGDAEKLGVDAETLCKLNPRLVYAQITGYGLDNPRAGYDAVIQAESGFQFMNGTPDGEPVKMPVALIDVMTAHQLKQAILLQLWRRERTGKGGAVNVSLISSAVSGLANQAMNYLKEGVIPQRMGSDHPSIAPYGTLYKSQNPEELLTLGVGTNSQFRALCEVLGHSEWADDIRFSTNPNRCANRTELNTFLQSEMSKWDRKELLTQLQAKKVPCGGVNNMQAAFDAPEAQEVVVMRPATDEELKTKKHLHQFKGNQPIGLRQAVWKGAGNEGLDAFARKFSSPPKYGEHTEEILKTILGKSEEDAQRLKDMFHSKK